MAVFMFQIGMVLEGRADETSSYLTVAQDWDEACANAESATGQQVNGDDASSWDLTDFQQQDEADAICRLSGTTLWNLIQRDW